VGFTPRAIRHVRCNWQFLISGVTSTSRTLHLGAMLRRCQLGHPYSGNISEAPQFGASDDHLWELLRNPSPHQATSRAQLPGIFLRSLLTLYHYSHAICRVCLRNIALLSVLLPLEGTAQQRANHYIIALPGRNQS